MDMKETMSYKNYLSAWRLKTKRKKKSNSVGPIMESKRKQQSFENNLGEENKMKFQYHLAKKKWKHKF